MELVTTNQKFNFNWTAYDQSPSLFVGFDLFDVTTGTAVFIQTITAAYAGFGVYTGTYTSGTPGNTYLVIGFAATDGTLSSVNPLYGPTCESFQVMYVSVTFLPINYATYDANDGLFIKAHVYDITTGTPTLVTSVVLNDIDIGVYFGHFTGTLGHTYAINTAVYTDGTYLTIDTNRAPGCESFDCISLNTTFVTVELQQAILEAQPRYLYLEGYCA